MCVVTRRVERDDFWDSSLWSAIPTSQSAQKIDVSLLDFQDICKLLVQVSLKERVRIYTDDCVCIIFSLLLSVSENVSICVLTGWIVFIYYADARCVCFLHTNYIYIYTNTSIFCSLIFCVVSSVLFSCWGATIRIVRLFSKPTLYTQRPSATLSQNK